MSIALKTATLAALTITAAASAAAITPGDLVIYRVGNGAQTLANTGNSVFLDEYTTAGSLVQSIAVDDTTAAGAVVASGTASSEGLLNVSPDGQYITLTGYNRPVGGTGSVVSTASTAVNRVVDVYGVNGTLLSNNKFSDYSTANNPRSAVTTDNATLTFGGAAGGVRTAAVAATTSTQINTAATTNIRDVANFGGQVYFSTSSATAGVSGIYSAGSAATPGQTQILSTGSLSSNYAFVVEDLSPTVAGPDTIYYADDGATTGGTAGIYKYSLVGGTWTAEGLVTAAAVRGLTATVNSDGSVSLFGTTGGSGSTGGGTLYGFTDSTGFGNAIASGTAATSLATAGTNQAFRGIGYIAIPAAVGTPEPASLALLGLGGLVALRRRRV